MLLPNVLLIETQSHPTQVDCLTHSWFMKKFTLNYLFLLILLLTRINSLAQGPNNGSIVIIGSRFTYPFIREVITDFKKVHPQVEVQLLERGTDTEANANLIINGHELQAEELRKGYQSVSFAEYVILPVANAANPWLAEVSKTGLDKKEIRSLFFNMDYDPIYNEKKELEKTSVNSNLQLYTRDQKACAPTSFASYYGLKQESLIGKRIVGSDLSLLYAVKADVNGLTYNLPVHLYNLETRKPLAEWTIIPIDQNGNNRVDEEEKIYDDLDELLLALSNNDTRNVPAATVNISLPMELGDSDRNLQLFVDFLLNDGQSKAGKYGFLGLSPEKLEKQKTLINSKL